MGSRNEKTMRECRRRLGPFVDGLVALDPERRRDEIRRALQVGIPATIRLLVEVLADRLDDDAAAVRAGASSHPLMLGITCQ
jgi:hypothetical protein